jgi:hypothetical protein
MSPWFFYNFAYKMSLWDFRIVVGKNALRTTQHKKIVPLVGNHAKFQWD